MFDPGANLLFPCASIRAKVQSLRPGIRMPGKTHTSVSADQCEFREGSLEDRKTWGTFKEGLGIGDWGLGIGDWELGIGDWGLWIRV